MVSFNWDINKNKTNIKKHGISFSEAKTVFQDYFALNIFDEKHSIIEERFLLLGTSINNNVLVVCYTYRDSDEVIRIISSRRANTNEIKQYNYRRLH